MANIANLSVNLFLNSNNFTKGMLKATASTKLFGAVLTSLKAKLLSFGRAMLAVGGLSGGGVVLLVRNVQNQMDTIGKLSAVLGLATETLVSWQRAAELAGATQEQFNVGLTTFVRRIGEAKAGYGEALKAFKVLGLSADEMSKAGTEKAIFKIADAWAFAGDASERAQIAFNLFGRQGPLISNMFAGGSKGLREAVEQARMMGILFDELESAKVEALNDSIVDTRNIIVGVLRQFTILGATPLNKAVNELNKSLIGTEGIAKRVDGLVDSILRKSGEIASFAVEVKGSFLGFMWIVKSVDLLLKAIWETGKAINKGVKAFTNLYKVGIEGAIVLWKALDLVIFDTLRKFRDTNLMTLLFGGDNKFKSITDKAVAKLKEAKDNFKKVFTSSANEISKAVDFSKTVDASRAVNDQWESIKKNSLRSFEVIKKSEKFAKKIKDSFKETLPAALEIAKRTKGAADEQERITKEMGKQILLSFKQVKLFRTILGTDLARRLHEQAIFAGKDTLPGGKLSKEFVDSKKRAFGIPDDSISGHTFATGGSFMDIAKNNMMNLVGTNAKEFSLASDAPALGGSEAVKELKKLNHTMKFVFEQPENLPPMRPAFGVVK
jgi:hypothetical protein